VHFALELLVAHLGDALAEREETQQHAKRIIFGQRLDQFDDLPASSKPGEIERAVEGMGDFMRKLFLSHERVHVKQHLRQHNHVMLPVRGREEFSSPPPLG
jgi:hypothetical protein